MSRLAFHTQIVGKALEQAYENGIKTGRPYKLQHFVLGRSRMENLGAAAVAAAFKASRIVVDQLPYADGTQKIGTLVEIVMNNNGMYEDDICALAAAFAANKGLQVKCMKSF